MIVSKNSWHYKFVDSIFRTPSKNLCTYFWQIIGSIFVYFCIASGIVAFTLVLVFYICAPLFALWAIFIHGFENVVGPGPDYFYGDIVGVGVLIMFFTTSFGIWRGTVFGIKKIRKIETKPNIATEYIRAKKEKVCSRINFE